MIRGRDAERTLSVCCILWWAFSFNLQRPKAFKIKLDVMSKTKGTANHICCICLDGHTQGKMLLWNKQTLAKRTFWNEICWNERVNDLTVKKHDKILIDWLIDWLFISEHLIHLLNFEHSGPPYIWLFHFSSITLLQHTSYSRKTSKVIMIIIMLQMWKSKLQEVILIKNERKSSKLQSTQRIRTLFYGPSTCSAVYTNM